MGATSDAPRGPLLVDQLRFMAEHWPDETAYRDLDSGDSITFAEWDEDSNRVARWLAAEGVGKGDRVSVYLPNEEALRWIVTYAAVHKAGAVAVPTNTRLSSRELATILGHAEISAQVTCESLLPTSHEVREHVPSWRATLSTGGRHGDVSGWDDTLGLDSGDCQVPVEEDDLADIMYTSGTTGLPKGVVVRHRDVAMMPNNVPIWTAQGWLHGAPMFTFAGIAFIFNPMKMGMTGLYLPRFDVDHWFDSLERDRPVMVFLVPSMAELITSHARFAEADLSSSMVVSIGSSPLAPATLLKLQDRMPQAAVTNAYGLTEAGPAYIVMPQEEVRNRPGSVGKPMPPMEIRVVDADGGDCPPGEVGELLVRLPGKQREYYHDDDATSRTWTADGWLHSGDLARLDEDGFVYIAGRIKDMIIRGGNNVYATDVEAAVLEHPAVQEVAVAGVPHDVLGEDVGAWVVVKPGYTLTEEEIKAFCEERLADYKRPRVVHFVAELPRNATGKVMKHRLHEPG